MPMSKKQILVEAQALDFTQRQELIDELRQMGDGHVLSPEQFIELGRRMAALARGEAILIDGDQAMREVREELGYR